FLVESGFAQQTDVARAFACSVRSVRRYQRRYAQDGMAALGREEGWRRGRRRISGKRLRSIDLLKNQGMSNRAIAHRLAVTEEAIRKQVGGFGPKVGAEVALGVFPGGGGGEVLGTGVPSSTSAGHDPGRAMVSGHDRGGGADPIPAPAD